MSKLILSTALGASFKKQADLHTASPAADIQRLTKLNASLSVVTPTVEDNAGEIGAGNEYATEQYKVAMNVSGSLEKYCSSEMLAWLMHFFMSKTTGASGTYTMVPSGVCDPLDLHSFTFVEQIGKDCGTAALDRALVGNVLSDFSIQIGTGASRQASRFSCNFVGCGWVDSPSGIVLPAAPLPEHFMPASSASVVVNGINYTQDKNLVSVEITGSNNVREGFYPGSGTQNDFAVQGRMERGTRSLGLRVVGRFDAGSLELEKLMNLTTGEAVVGIQHSAAEAFEAKYHKVGFRSAQIGEDNGIVTVATDIAPLYDPTDGIFTATCKTAVALG